ncbi:hypothetical protein SDC9_145475 [bioreactor metagenome]|uniref:DUF92 domain-containing protein n=1 Tax=bioreactor metagenome TaxID=1076179 RepID=A0A645E923_9ZZZZ|nr:hypothetical protein [Oscillospiraceae bacterium]
MPLWITIIFAIISALTIFAVVGVYKRGEKPYAESALSSYVFYLIAFIAIWIFDLPVPTFIIVLTMLTVFISGFFGHYLGWYIKSKVFDRYLHAFGSFSFALLAYFMVTGIITTGESKIFQALFVFTAGMTLGSVFELSEASHDRGNVLKNQKGLKDTNMDMLCDLLGSFAAGVFYFFL